MPDQARLAGHPLVVALRLLRAGAPERILGVPQDWPRWAGLLPHVLAAASHLDSGADRYGPDAMADASWLLNRAGTYLQVHGRLTDAQALLERALAITEAAYGPDHPDVARDLNNLAQILQDLGQLEAARALQERALAITQAAYGPDHPDVATRLNNLAQILQDLGQPEAARPLQERALAITEAAKSARSEPAGEEGDAVSREQPESRIRCLTMFAQVRHQLYCSEVVVRGGVEPPTFRFSGGRSYQLSYLTVPGRCRPLA
jgi:tetratricopeptide (TPR) repeat protein